MYLCVHVCIDTPTQHAHTHTQKHTHTYTHTHTHTSTHPHVSNTRAVNTHTTKTLHTITCSSISMSSCMSPSMSHPSTPPPPPPPTHFAAKSCRGATSSGTALPASGGESGSEESRVHGGVGCGIVLLGAENIRLWCCTLGSSADI